MPTRLFCADSDLRFREYSAIYGQGSRSSASYFYKFGA
jgi:hypothetical protein